MSLRDVLVARYCGDRTVERRNAVVDAHRHLCVRGARKFKQAHNDRADLEQVAALGLIKAADNYRAELQAPFQAYAWIMIVGELIHYVRDHERLVRAPRSLSALAKRYASAWDAFTSTNHREPTATEMATALRVAPAVIAELRALRRVEHVPLPEPDAQDGPERIDLLGDPHPGLGLDQRIALTVAVDEFGDGERAILVGTYCADLTQDGARRAPQPFTGPRREAPRPSASQAAQSSVGG